MRLVFTIMIALFATAAQADIIFAPSFAYVNIEDDDASSPPASEQTVTSYDFKIAYLHPSGLVLGGMYSMGEYSENDNFSTGPTVGFNHYSGFYALFTYHLMAEQDLGGGVAKLTDGMGPQIDIGWVFPLTHMFHLGPQITYRSIKYDKSEALGISSPADYTISNIMPAVSLWFRF